MRQNYASGLPNPARGALHIFACERGRLQKFAAEMLGTLRKSNELENGESEVLVIRHQSGFAKNLGPELKKSCAPQTKVAWPKFRFDDD